MFRLTACLIGLGCLLVVGVANIAVAADDAPPAKDAEISMDFQDVDIRVLIKFIGELTGKNFIVDRGVVGKVSVFSPSPVSMGEAYEVFNSVLQVNGFTTIPSGKVIKIVPLAKARDDGVATVSSRTRPAGPSGSFVTQIIPLKYAAAEDMVRSLSPLVAKTGLIASYNSANTLIVSDYASNVDRILKIVRTLDQHIYGKSLVVVALEHGQAKDVAEKTDKILSASTASSPGIDGGRNSSSVVIYDDRTNTLLALVSPEREQTLRELVAALDVPTPRGKGDVHLVYLENANAEEAAKVLTSLVQGQTLEGEKKQALSRDIKVVADKGTNSLLIASGQSDFKVLDEVIKKLDVKRRQVFVEALIMEVTTDGAFSMGVNWAGAGSTDQGVVFGAINTGAGSSGQSDGNTTFPAGGSIGFIQFPITIGGISFNSLQSVISFSKTDNQFNVLSAPQLLTLDNEEATVTVAENIPYSTQVDSGTSTTDKSVQSFDYRDVGVILKLTPQIGEKDTVRLKINQQVSRVVDRLVTNSDSDYVILAPTTRKREVDTSVMVKDGQTIVIAGLLEKEKTTVESKVPGLGDIPLLGNLFRYKSTTDGKKNLYVFLTPKIVDTLEDAERIYRDKRSRISALQMDGDGLAPPRIIRAADCGLEPMLPQ